eukprot:GHVO01006538.1.p1 GENE.GHVO01006538.1~~GHVO01006538.1.p1  ORF type:complete len:143 (+),score=13.64 GHVO01006538.1:89-517(+)
MSFSLGLEEGVLRATDFKLRYSNKGSFGSVLEIGAPVAEFNDSARLNSSDSDGLKFRMIFSELGTAYSVTMRDCYCILNACDDEHHVSRIVDAVNSCVEDRGCCNSILVSYGKSEMSGGDDESEIYVYSLSGCVWICDRYPN